MMRFCIFICDIGWLVPALSRQYRVFSIVTQTLPICEELFKVHCSNFAAKEKSSSDQSSDRHPVSMVDPSQKGGHCFYSITDLK